MSMRASEMQAWSLQYLSVRQPTDRHSIKTEIECPHCFDLMILSSDFDSLSYVCEACGFTLYTTRLAP